MPQAAPVPLFGAVYQIGLERVALHVPADLQKMVIFLDGKRFESSLIKMTGPGISAMSVPALSVPALSVCQRHPADKSRQFPIVVRFDDEVPVIAHHAKRQQISPSPFDRLKQDPFKRRVIVFVLKDRQPRDSARDKSTHLPTLASLSPSNEFTKPTPKCQ